MTRPSAPAAPEPIADPERLFRRLGGADGLVLAVSGGPDSTALMALAAGWRNRPPVIVVSVDHGLRPEAGLEARQVAANAATLGLPSRIVQAPAWDRTGNLQDWARCVRYRSLAEAGRDAGFDTIVTAHHRDDQAETFLMRLARGSGVQGLASMAEESSVEGMRLVRPLLGVSRDTLHRVAAGSGLPFADDPSNADHRFERARLRALMPELRVHGLDARRLAGTAASLRRAAEALDHYAGELLAAHFCADQSGAVRGDAAALADAPDEVALRVLARTLQAVSGAVYAPKLDKLEQLRAAVIGNGARGAFRRTLHGTVVSLEQGRLAISREWGRDGIPGIAAHARSNLVWDGRFRILVPASNVEASIGALGRSERRLRSSTIPSAAIPVLPGLFAGGALVAAPAGVSVADDGDALGTLAAHCIVGARLGLPVRPEVSHAR